MSFLRYGRTAQVGLTACLAIACGNGNPPAERDFCGVLQGYVAACEELTHCENAIVRDCRPLEGALAEPYVDASIQCIRGVGTPMHCLWEAYSATLSSQALERFAKTLCLECGTGAGSCEDRVIAGEDDDALSRAGRLARVLSPSLLETIERECATGSDCAGEFENCTRRVLARSVPAESIGCLIDAVIEGQIGPSCANPGDTGTGTTGGGATDNGL